MACALAYGMRCKQACEPDNLRVRHSLHRVVSHCVLNGSLVLFVKALDVRLNRWAGAHAVITPAIAVHDTSREAVAVDAA